MLRPRWGLGFARQENWHRLVSADGRKIRRRHRTGRTVLAGEGKRLHRGSGLGFVACLSSSVTRVSNWWGG